MVALTCMPSVKAVYGFGTACTLVFAALSYERIDSLRNPRSAWTDSLNKTDFSAPPTALGRWRPALNLSQVELLRGNPDAALMYAQQAIKLDEFKKSIRDPITTALESCDDVASRAEAIATSNKPLSEVLQEIEDLNRDAIKAFSRLSDRLDDADQSTFASSNTWLNGYDSAEERVLGCFNEACNNVNIEAKRRAALQRIKSEFRTYRSTVIRRVEAEITSIS